MVKVTRLMSNRSGVATLEFVMALPLLFVLTICIMWEGFWLIGQAEVLITARNDAWKKRFDNAADSPLIFPVLETVSLYNANKDFVTKKASTKVKISPAFDLIPGPESSHTILAGSWDHKAMPMNEPPDFGLMGKAAILGGLGSVLDLAASASDPLGLVGKFTSARKDSETIDRNTKAEAEQSKNDDSSGGSGTGTGSGTGGSSDGKTPEQAKQESKEELERQKLAAKKRFVELGGTIDYQDIVTPVKGELETANDAVDSAQKDSEQKSKAARDEKDDEKKKELQAEAARANRKYELAKITLERLKAECISVANEADGLGIERWELNVLVTGRYF
jgi:uncharacterized membrane protein YgcG